MRNETPTRASRELDAEIHRAIASVQGLTELFRERRRQLAREGGLSEAQWQLLEEIADETFMPSMFARRRACTPAAISRTLRPLLDERLVSVAVSDSDGRQRVYRLTARGRRALERLGAGREAAIEAVWRHLPAREVSAFADFAERLGQRLSAYAGEREERRQRSSAAAASASNRPIARGSRKVR